LKKEKSNGYSKTEQGILIYWCLENWITNLFLQTVAFISQTSKISVKI